MLSDRLCICGFYAGVRCRQCNSQATARSLIVRLDIVLMIWQCGMLVMSLVNKRHRRDPGIAWTVSQSRRPLLKLMERAWWC
jgi:hypothetical protein